MLVHPANTDRRQRIPRELPEHVEEEVMRLRALSFEERGRMIIAACQLAADIEAGKRQMGMPPSKPTPWPASTLEFFKQRIAHGRR